MFQVSNRNLAILERSRVQYLFIYKHVKHTGGRGVWKSVFVSGRIWGPHMLHELQQYHVYVYLLLLLPQYSLF